MLYRLNGREITVNSQYLLSVQQVNSYSVVNVGEIEITIGSDSVQLEHGRKSLMVFKCAEVECENLSNYRVRLDSDKVTIECLNVRVVADMAGGSYLIEDTVAETPFIVEEA